MRSPLASLRDLRDKPWRTGLRGLLALLLLLACGTAALAQAPAPVPERTLVLQPDTREVRPGLLLDVLEDASQQLTIDDIVAGGDKLPWQASRRTVPSFGLSHSAVWLRLHLANRTEPERRWILAVNYPPLQRVDVYLQGTRGEPSRLAGGSALPLSQRPMAHANHLFPLQLQREGTVWIRVQTEGSMSVPLTLWQAEAFEQHDARATLAHGGFIGLMLGLMIFNLLVGLLNREPVHLLYFVCSASYLAYFSTTGGLGALHLWPENPALGPKLICASAAVGGAASCLFTHRLLELGRLRCWTGRLLLGVAAMCFVVLLLRLTGMLPHRLTVGALLVLTGASCLLFPVAALQADRRGVFVARYFVVGWAFLMLGVFVTVLSAIGVLPGSLLTDNAPGIGFGGSTLLLTVALGARLRDLQSEKEVAQAERFSAEQDAARSREEALRSEVRASKAAGLAEALETLEELGRIGREVTGNLDGEAVFTALHRHLQGLMDGHAFALFRVDTALVTRSLVYGVEDGRRLPAFDSALAADDPARRCVRERRAVLQGFAPGEAGVVVGTAETLSVMYAPLYLGERLLGVLTVQSARAQAYGEREVAIFETLCAYAAIALANAETFQALRAAQARIVQQEKMASLGVLTAGMAHEINNPAHFARLAGQNAAAQVEALRAFVDSLLGEDTDPAIGQAFETRFAQIRASLQTSAEGIERIARVIQRLRAENPEGIGIVQDADLVALLESAWQTFAPSARVALAMHTDFRCRPMQACSVAEVKQLFLALLGNAHDAIASTQRPGRIGLSAHERGSGAQREVVIEVRDNGSGIAPQHLERVFDPFFTTKPVGQGMGLGLSMARDTAMRHGWRLQAASVPGEGAVFSLVLPPPQPVQAVSDAAAARASAAT